MVQKESSSSSLDLTTLRSRAEQCKRLADSLGGFELAHGLNAVDREMKYRAQLAERDATITTLRDAVKTVVTTFERDEAQGYRSKDRQFAIEVLKVALPAEKD